MPTIKIIPMPGPQGPTGPTGSGGGTDLGLIKTGNWNYPTQNGVAIQPSLDGESIALKSSNSASLRWHVRDGGPSVANYSINAIRIIQQTGEMGVGPYQVQFEIDEQAAVPPIGYTYDVSGQNGSPWDGAYRSTAATLTTLTLEYPGPNIPGANEEFLGGSIYPPSLYNQVEARPDGVWIKNANWSEDPMYSYYWKFGVDGSVEFPNQSSNNRTGYGNVLRFADSTNQAIITGPKPNADNPTAERLVIAGQDGYTDSSGNFEYSEGGDIYLWAGQGTGQYGSGGDIKLDGGSSSQDGEGGTVKMRGGYSPNGTGGFVEINAGYGGLQGGTVYINGGGGATPGNVQVTSYHDLTFNSTANTGFTYGPEFNISSSVAPSIINLGAYAGVKINSSHTSTFTDEQKQVATIGDLPTGATGSFTSADGKTITVTNGIITGIE